MKKNNKRSIFDSKRVTLVCCFLVALLSWIIVAGFINPGSDFTISRVSIDYAKKENEYKNKNLQIVGEIPATFAEVRVSGDGSLIGRLTNTDVSVYADYSGVMGPGTYTIPLQAEKVAPGSYSLDDWTTKTTGSNRPVSSIDLTFEEVSSKTLKIEVRSDNLTASAGFFKDTPQLSAQELTVTGPKSNVARVEKAEAAIEDELELSENAIYSGVPVVLRDQANQPLDPDLLELTLSVETVEVNVHILEVREVALSVGIVGVSSTFDTEWLESRIHLDNTSMNVVGTTEALNNLGGTLHIGDIDVSTLSIGWEPSPFPVSLPEDGTGLRNYDQLKQVTVSFDSTDLVEKEFTVENIRIKNQPQGVEITPTLQSVPNVTLIGPAEEIDALLPEEIVVEIDAFGVVPSRDGQQTIPARIVIPSAQRVFAIGDYPQICDVTVEE